MILKYETEYQVWESLYDQLKYKIKKFKESWSSA